MTDAPIALVDGQIIRLAGWSAMTYASFGTVEGFARNKSPMYRKPGDEEGAFARATERGHDTAYSVYAGAALVNDPSGAWHAREAAKVAGAVTLEDGALIQAEGRTYRVKVLKGNAARPIYSNPIAFSLVTEEG